MEVPQESIKLFQNKKTRSWPVDKRGYFTKRDGRSYNPSELQRSFVWSTARFAAFYGPRGSGKSGAGAQKVLRKVMLGESGVVMNPDMENFKLSTWPELKEWIPWHMVVPSQRHRQREEWDVTKPFTMVFMNGSKIYCKGLKDPESARGPNVNFLWYDEAGRDKTGMGWKIAIAGVRKGKDPQAWATFTPKTSEHWTTKFFVNKDIPEEAKKQFAEAIGDDKILIESFHASRMDNAANLDEGFYASILVANPSGWLKSQEYDGEVADEGGQVGYRSWFKDRIITTLPVKVIKRVRAWDMAASEKKVAKDDPDETVGTLVSKFVPKDNEEWMSLYGHLLQDGQDKQNHYIIENQISGYWIWEKLLEVIKNTAKHDSPFVEVYIEQEPGSGGKNQVAAVASAFTARDCPELHHHTVHEVDSRKVGDRVLAANNYWFGIASEGRLWMMMGSWNEGTLGQIDSFTQTEHDDKVTSITSAMYILNPYRAWKKVPFVSI